MIQQMLAIWTLVPLPFPKPYFYIWKLSVPILLKPSLKDFEYNWASKLCSASLVAQLVKNLSAMQETPVWFLSREDPWRREWLPTPVFLPGEFQGQNSLVGYCPWGSKESDTTEWLTHTYSPWGGTKSPWPCLTAKLVLFGLLWLFSFVSACSHCSD